MTHRHCPACHLPLPDCHALLHSCCQLINTVLIPLYNTVKYVGLCALVLKACMYTCVASPGLLGVGSIAALAGAP